jgi:nitrogen fixation/metabolism regulation signal transduction histidine kinase
LEGHGAFPPPLQSSIDNQICDLQSAIGNSMRFDRRILLFTLAAGLPAVAAALLLLWLGGYAARTQWTVSALIVGVWLACASAVRHRVVLPLQTISNLLAALRERDFSIRPRAGTGETALSIRPVEDPLAAVMREVSDLATTLHDQRLDALEAGALLRTVMLEIDVAVFAFDGGLTLRLVNRAGERLLGLPADRLLGRTAVDLGLQPCLEGGPQRVEQVSFPGGSGRWEVRRSTFRQEGRPHQLLVLADVSQPLRDEERQAWQRLIRVIGHEINNSLAPIKSIAGSLESMLARDPVDGERGGDLRRGLAVISSRSDALSRFTTAYAKLAKLPTPRVTAVVVSDLVRRVAGLETRVPVDVENGPDLTIQADPDQMEQLLINLARNAADASLETGGGVVAGWRLDGRTLVVWIEDEGAGLPNRSNLFVPFYTTKPEGTGVGLVLSRQIAEAHGGTLSLDERGDRPGCRATLRVPIR